MSMSHREKREVWRQRIAAFYYICFHSCKCCAERVYRRRRLQTGLGPFCYNAIDGACVQAR